MQTATVEIRFSSRSILESFFGAFILFFILACQGLGLLHSTGFEVPARVLKGLGGECCSSSNKEECALICGLRRISVAALTSLFL